MLAKLEVITNKGIISIRTQSKVIDDINNATIEIFKPKKLFVTFNEGDNDIESVRNRHITNDFLLEYEGTDIADGIYTEEYQSAVKYINSKDIISVRIIGYSQMEFEFSMEKQDDGKYY